MDAHPSMRPCDTTQPTCSVHTYAIEESIAAALADALASEHHVAADVERDTDPDAHGDGVGPATIPIAVIPTCARGFVVAAITVALVAAAALSAVAAYRRPSTGAMRSLITYKAPSIATQLPSEEPAPSPSLAAASQPTVDVDLQSEPTMGALALPPAAEGHRVYLDGHVIGDASFELLVACGRHVVKIGSRGREQKVLVPCGGDVRLTYP